jgi:arginine decarboxylase
VQQPSPIRDEPPRKIVPRLTIPIVAGIGRGRTLLSAFDSALYACGIHNFNLIPLSSVIPAATAIIPVERYDPLPDEHGHRLYVVKAEARSDHPGRAIAAGVGWYQWGDGRGVFVEHEVVGATRDAVTRALRGLIRDSLRDLCLIRDVQFLERRARCEIACADVAAQPASALVVAVYRARGWGGRPDDDGGCTHV